MSGCDTCLVRNRAICDALDSTEIEALNKIGRRRMLQPGDPLIWEGEDSLLVANVIEGMLKLTNSTEDGREQIVGVVYPSDFIGRPFGATSNHSVTALTQAKVCVFSRSDFDRVAGENQALEHRLLQRTLDELDRSRKWMLLLARKSAEEKVATFLLDMSERLVDQTCETPVGGVLAEFDLPFSRQQIGDILGITIETASRQMTRLKRENIIELPTRRTVRICDRAALEAMAG